MLIVDGWGWWRWFIYTFRAAHPHAQSHIEIIHKMLWQHWIFYTFEWLWFLYICSFICSHLVRMEIFGVWIIKWRRTAKIENERVSAIYVCEHFVVVVVWMNASVMCACAHLTMPAGNRMRGFVSTEGGSRDRQTNTFQTILMTLKNDNKNNDYHIRFWANKYDYPIAWRP